MESVEQFLTSQNEQPEDMWGMYLKDNKSSLRKLLPQSSTSPTPNLFSSTHNRKWRIINPGKVLSEFNDETPALASIEVRTRNDSTTGTVPERLYSSLKYEVTQEISSHTFANTAVLMSRLQIVNPYNFEEEILKTNGKSIVKGTSELIPLTLNGTALYSKTKVQFTDVSYHHEKKYFALKVSYFDPNNLSEPVFVQMSAPFQVFARRPRRKSLKRKSTHSATASIPKKIKEEKKVMHISTIPPISSFFSQLSSLESLGEKLNENDKKQAIESLEKFCLRLRVKEEPGLREESHYESERGTAGYGELDFFYN